MSHAPGQGTPRPSVLRERSYRYLLGAATISNFGSMLHALALPFVAVAVLDATPADIATLTAAGLLPAFLLGPFASAWVDRLPRRALLVSTDCARAAVVLFVPLAALGGVLDLVQLHAVVALHGLLSFLFGAAHHAILPAVVRADRLLEANGRLKGAEAVSEAAAFASGGWLVQWIGAPLVLAVDAASYLVSAWLLRGVDAREPAPAVQRAAPAGPRSVLRETAEGLRFLLGHRLLLPSALALALAALSWRMTGVVYLLFVYEELGFAPGVLGMVFAAGGVASLAGSFAAERLATRLGVGPTMVAGLAGFGLATLLLPLAPGTGAAGLVILLVHQLGDGCEVLFEVSQASLRQSATPTRLLGRVAGGVAFASTGAMLLGLAMGGVLGERLGLRAVLWVAGGVTLAAAALLALSPLGATRALPTPED